MPSKFTMGDTVYISGDTTLHQIGKVEADEITVIKPDADPYKVPVSWVGHVYPLQQYFAFGHLPQDLQQASQPFHYLANHIVATLPRGHSQVFVALQKLLEAKDAAVRARLP